MLEEKIEVLKKLQVELKMILEEALQLRDEDRAWEKLGRWKSRAVKSSQKYVSADEAKKLDEQRLGVYTLDDGLTNIKYDVNQKQTLINTLIEEMQEHPELFTDSENTKTSSVSESALSKLEKIFNRFQKVARQLQKRHGNRSAHTVNDEYDVQDLLHALLWLEFDDVRAEEWTPSHAGKAARTDFLLKNERVVIEVKKTREGLSEKELGDDLIIDIARYKNHSDCKSLICFIYDPEGRIGNPSGLTRDLESHGSDSLLLRVVVRPEF